MADKDFKVKNGIDVAGNANIDGNLNAAKYQDSAPSSPVNGQIWIDSNATASVINTNDFLLKADATSIYETQTDAASTYAPLASPTFTGTVTTPIIRVTETDDASLSSTGHGLQVGLTNGVNIAVDGNEIMARNNGAASPLYLNNDGGDVYVVGGSGSNGDIIVGNTTGSNTLTMNGSVSATGSIRADSGGADGGLVMRPWTGGSSWTSLATNGMTGEEYILMSQGARTLLGAGGGDIELRPGTNSVTNQLTVSATGAHELSGAVLNGATGGQGTTTSGGLLTVTHGLGKTPAAVTVSVRSNSYNAALNTNIFCGTIASTTFTTYANNGAGGAVAAAFSWIAVA